MSYNYDINLFTLKLTEYLNSKPKTFNDGFYTIKHKGNFYGNVTVTQNNVTVMTVVGLAAVARLIYFPKQENYVTTRFLLPDKKECVTKQSMEEILNEIQFKCIC